MQNKGTKTLRYERGNMAFIYRQISEMALDLGRKYHATTNGSRCTRFQSVLRLEVENNVIWISCVQPSIIKKLLCWGFEGSIDVRTLEP